MKAIRSMHKSLISALAIAMLGMVTLSLAATPSAEPVQKAKINHYIGAAKCKNCHNVAENGAQYDCWTKSKHAEAFKTLGGDEAKKVATEKGIADAQKDEKCLKCHETGFGLAADQFDKKFDKTAGVQCETCHGPGEQHMKARLAAAATEENPDPKVRKKVAEGEIEVPTGPKLCEGCHNKESPSYKTFEYPEFLKKIAHYDPRSDRKDKAPKTKDEEKK
ncbi:MAG: cytochrome c family protein [Planctomycetes bacterium]|nr:cytochrome c family protein [Planctomycetota bacterium]